MSTAYKRSELMARGIFQEPNSELVPQNALRLESALKQTNALPTYTQLNETRQQILQLLDSLFEKLKAPPITLIEHDGCFTNAFMRRALLKVLQRKEHLDRYVDIRTLPSDKKAEGSLFPKYRPFPNVERNGVYIFGGSTNDTENDVFGGRYITNLTLPFLDDVKDGKPKYGIGVCFGHQALLKAYGIELSGRVGDERQRGLIIPDHVKKTSLIYSDRREPEFGLHPVRFLLNHPALETFIPFQEEVLGAFSRSFYPVADHFHSFSEYSEIIPLMTRSSREFVHLRDKVDHIQDRLAPLGTTFMGPYEGKVITTQIHPEIDVRQRSLYQKFQSAINEYLSQTKNKKQRKQSNSVLEPEFFHYPPTLYPYFYFSDEVVQKRLKGSLSPLFFVSILHYFLREYAGEMKAGI